MGSHAYSLQNKLTGYWHNIFRLNGIINAGNTALKKEDL
jgi:hypothetical protein